MQISIRTSDRTIVQYGRSVGALDGCEIAEVDDSLLDTLRQPGMKTLSADGSITVRPDLEAQAAQEAAATALAQREQDAAVLLAVLPTQAAKDALSRLLGL